MFRRRWFSTKSFAYLTNKQYWAVVYLVERRLGHWPVEIRTGRAGLEYDRIYMLSWFDTVRVQFLLRRVNTHPAFGVGRVGV